MSRHLYPVPDEGPLHDVLAAVELVRRAPLEPSGVPIVSPAFARRHPTPWGPALGAEPVTEPPGWWACPDCGRRVDRGTETRTITARYCTGPEGALRHRRHTPVAMVVQR